jgi:hypothetical protein
VPRRCPVAAPHRFAISTNLSGRRLE